MNYRIKIVSDYFLFLLFFYITSIFWKVRKIVFVFSWIFYKNFLHMFLFKIEYLLLNDVFLIIFIGTSM